MTTIEQLMKCYRVVALTERMKTGRPSEDTVANVLRGTRIVCQAAGIALTSPVTALTRQRVDTALADFMEQGLARITAWSHVCQLRGLFAKWCRPYYQDAGLDVPPLDLPAFRAQAPRYERPSSEMLARVCWPIHDDIWARLDEYGGWSGLDVTSGTFEDINRDLRALGFRGSKAAYELRKICIDHVYQKFGAEMAVSISGDDISTITRYYADPAQPNVYNIRVTDLI